MANIVITDRGKLDGIEAIEFLRSAGHEVAVLDTLDAADVASRAADADALIISFARITRDTIAAIPNLKAIATTSVGVNTIDIEAASERGITVSNMPSVASEEVATHAIGGMLSLVRELRTSYELVEHDEWDYSKIPLPPRLSNLTLGLFGLGRIARHVADRADALVADLIAFDPFVPADAWPANIRRAESLDELLEASNILSLHAPLTQETQGIIDDAALAKLPRGAYLINVARGELVSTQALVSALDSGQITGAFLDVLDVEPADSTHPLVKHPRTLVTPHAAFRSAQTVSDYFMIPARNVCAVLDGQEPLTRVD